MITRSFRSELMLWFGGLLLVALVAVLATVEFLASRTLVQRSGFQLQVRTKSAADLLSTNLRERVKELVLLSHMPLLVQHDPDSADVFEALGRARTRSHRPGARTWRFRVLLFMEQPAVPAALPATRCS